ncbi:Predicted transcriptional regulator, contains HTH domain [Halogranum amylolyticum]|uniref:Predicted transcriptional regulator, contains HTH domain n=1 Tax=Halogranum amylolyticum TaxID=660520 RepID=A0A1H8S3H7_9EURY|nr:transcriptional regulator [Halogranum amylolyticum]SEO73251.1 Predicted transcriptional regulator, contains HTH domain [Halogranum amylolyticum]
MTNRQLLDELIQHALDLQTYGDTPSERTARLDTDELVDVVRHRSVLELLFDGPRDRRDIEAALGVSRATSHRFTRWLEDNDLAERVDGRFVLTGKGQVVAESTLRFERNLVTAGRLAPLLDAICEDHQEFVVEPFADATVTVPTPSDPYAPVTRFLSLLRDSETFRGFNTTHMVPPSTATPDPVFEGRDVELIYLPDVVERLRTDDPERFDAALEAGSLTLHTRSALPYGLAVFDDRVGIGGYDEETGAMRVFVDTDATIAREWAERVYDSYRRHSTPLDESSSTEQSA